MGSTTGFNSRTDVVDTLVKQHSTNGFSIIDRKATNFGRHLWMLIQPKKGPSFICLFVLSSYQHDWGYKDVDESMGMYQWDCPATLIQQADPPSTETAKQWREQILNYRARGRR